LKEAGMEQSGRNVPRHYERDTSLGTWIQTQKENQGKLLLQRGENKSIPEYENHLQTIDNFE
jgi:hypothetical protein